MTDLIILQRLAIALFLGAIIGFEREKAGHSPGLRTHILVSLGSCLIMLISLYVFEIYRYQATVDPGRIVAGVVTGIGFLGAGAIIRSQEGIRGLTSAATIWVSSAIGMAAGCGFIVGAIGATVLSYLTLSSLKRVEKWLQRD